MIRTRFWKIGTIALLTGVPGCGSEADLSQGEPQQAEPTDIPELGISMEGLGTVVNSCNDGNGVGASGNYDSASKTMTLALAGGSNVFSVVGTAVTVNGWSCYDEDGVALTTTNVKKMNITTSASAASKVVFDLLPGSFGSIFSTTGGVTIDFDHASDEFAVRGNTSANKMKIGETGGDVYVEVSGDTKADIKLTGAANIPGSLTFLLGDGADTFEAIDVATISASHIDSAATALDPLSATYSLIVYGGEGDDTIRGGLGDDDLYGNAGNDTFLNDDGDDGSDEFWGGAGTDTVSYAGRSASVTADINPIGVSASGTVDMTGLTFPYTGDISLQMDSDDDGDVDGSDAAAVVLSATAATDAADIITDFMADSDLPTGVTLTIDSRNHLLIRHATRVFDVVTGQDEADFGLTVATYTASSGDADDGESGEADDLHEDVENIIGGSAADTLTGNSGSNTLTGGGGNDDLSGGAGGASCASDVDVLNGGDGNDTFKMGPLTDCGDEFVGGAGTDTVDYQYRTAALTITVDGAANDGLASEADNVKTDVEVIIGGSAGDTITGGNGNETIHGGAGNDIINGGAGNDTLIGNAGNDTLNGAAGDDTFDNEGDDAVFANSGSVTTDDKGAGADLINGGTGTDKVTYTGRTAAVSVTMCTDAAAATGAAVTSPVPAVCTDSDGSAGSLTGTADLTSFDYSSSTGDLVLAVGTTLYTVTLDGAANATAVAGLINGTATLNSAVTAAIVSNNLVITLDDLSSTTAVTIDATTTDQVATDLGLTEGDAITNEGDKVINAEWLVGGDGDDILTGHTAGETIEGGDGDDAISGGAGDDTLYGDNDDDTINGGDGNDALYGGAGDDQLVGGNGDADICEYVAASDTTAAPLTCEFVN